MDERNRSIRNFGRFLVFLGTGLFLSVAFSRANATEPLAWFSEEAAQLATSFIVLGFGTAMMAGSLRPITWQAQLRKHSIDQSDSRLGFASIHHRGSLLFKDD